MDLQHQLDDRYRERFHQAQQQLAAASSSCAHPSPAATATAATRYSAHDMGAAPSHASHPAHQQHQHQQAVYEQQQKHSNTDAGSSHAVAAPIYATGDASASTAAALPPTTIVYYSETAPAAGATYETTASTSVAQQQHQAYAYDALPLAPPEHHQEPADLGARQPLHELPVPQQGSKAGARKGKAANSSGARRAARDTSAAPSDASTTGPSAPPSMPTVNVKGVTNGLTAAQQQQVVISLLAPDYTLNPAGPASNADTVFPCQFCDKKYQGKHARSIWRRHLQDKHGIPLSQQPRRTRWDNDASKPASEEERRARSLASKRRWARKNRASAAPASVEGSMSPQPQAALPASAALQPPFHPDAHATDPAAYTLAPFQLGSAAPIHPTPMLHRGDTASTAEVLLSIKKHGSVTPPLSATQLEPPRPQEAPHEEHASRGSPLAPRTTLAPHAAVGGGARKRASSAAASRPKRQRRSAARRSLTPAAAFDDDNVDVANTSLDSLADVSQAPSLLFEQRRAHHAAIDDFTPPTTSSDGEQDAALDDDDDDYVEGREVTSSSHKFKQRAVGSRRGRQSHAGSSSSSRPQRSSSVVAAAAAAASRHGTSGRSRIKTEELDVEDGEEAAGPVEETVGPQAILLENAAQTAPELSNSEESNTLETKTPDRRLKGTDSMVGGSSYGEDYGDDQLMPLSSASRMFAGRRHVPPMRRQATASSAFASSSPPPFESSFDDEDDSRPMGPPRYHRSAWARVPPTPHIDMPGSSSSASSLSLQTPAGPTRAPASMMSASKSIFHASYLFSAGGSAGAGVDGSRSAMPGWSSPGALLSSPAHPEISRQLGLIPAPGPGVWGGSFFAGAPRGDASARRGSALEESWRATPVSRPSTSRRPPMMFPSKLAAPDMPSPIESSPAAAMAVVGELEELEEAIADN